MSTYVAKCDVTPRAFLDITVNNIIMEIKIAEKEICINELNEKVNSLELKINVLGSNFLSNQDLIITSWTDSK